MSQAAPTFCIHAPTFDATEAINNPRNKRWSKGANADVVSSFVSGVGAAVRSVMAGFVSVIRYVQNNSSHCGEEPLLPFISHDKDDVRLGRFRGQKRSD